MVVDLSGFSYFIPIFGFLLVTIVVYALLMKLKILGEDHVVALFVAFIIAIIFVSMTSVRQVVENVIPWFALLIIALFFIFVIIGFSQGKFDKAPTWLMWTFVLILVGVFLVSLMKVFSNVIFPYLPGNPGPQDPFLFKLKEFFYSSRFWGAILLLVIAGITAKVLVRKD